MSADHASNLEKHGLASFDTLWNYEGEWFEEPNRKRGGWSGVNYFSLSGQGYFLKRQFHYQRRSLRHPIVGEPTYWREFKMLQYLDSKGVGIPELVYFAKQQQASIIITAELSGYVPADAWLDQHPIDKQPLLQSLARAVKQLHNEGVVHRALFLKHLFVKPMGNSFEVAMIDFEKARRSPFIMVSRYLDIKRCLNRASQLSEEEKRYFLKQYWQVDTLTWWQQVVTQWILGKK